MNCRGPTNTGARKRARLRQNALPAFPVLHHGRRHRRQWVSPRWPWAKVLRERGVALVWLGVTADWNASGCRLKGSDRGGPSRAIRGKGL